MKYISTRGQSSARSFCGVLLSGLGEDGGLFVPEFFPQVGEKLAQWRNLEYRDLAFEIMSLFIDDLPDLRTIVDKTYRAEVFGHQKDITPIRALKDGLYILGLSYGPTLAFKDVAMQFLGNAFESVLSRENKTLNIVGATSGDTGSAAEYAMRGKKGVRVFMLSPNGKMSAFQRAQMYSLHDENIFNLAVDGLFDNCQDIVKAIQADADFKQKYNIGTINSINWARILAQVVYYFKAYFAIGAHQNEKVSFCVPSGNFGDIFAGFVAKMMGLPIARLIVATNENNVLDEFFRTGLYRPRRADEVAITSSPSMDIAKASNLERFVFEAVGRDDARIRDLWQKVNSGEGFDLSSLQSTFANRFGFASGASTHQNRLDTIADVYQSDSDAIDPHTAAGVFVARQLRQEGETMVCLETALSAKFEETMQEALGADFVAPCPHEWRDLKSKDLRFEVMPDNAEAVKAFIRDQVDR